MNNQPKPTFKQKVNHATTVTAVAVTPLMLSAMAFAEEAEVTIPTSVALTGLGTAAATVFAIKAAPSLMMWGYRKVLGFIGR